VLHVTMRIGRNVHPTAQAVGGNSGCTRIWWVWRNLTADWTRELRCVSVLGERRYACGRSKCELFNRSMRARACFQAMINWAHFGLLGGGYRRGAWHVKKNTHAGSRTRHRPAQLDVENPGKPDSDPRA
jgi:hypothetical protein